MEDEVVGCITNSMDMSLSKLWQMVTAAMKAKDACYDQPRQHIKKHRHYLADKGPSNQSYGFFSSYV